jgi:predicted Zn-dependent protease
MKFNFTRILYTSTLSIPCFFLIILLSACSGSAHQLAKVTDSDISQIKNEASSKKTVFKTFNRSNSANRALVVRTSNRLLNHARPVCEHTGYNSCFFQVLYDAGDTINAYASENYKIVIYRGLLEYLETEDEVAAVIAHEMGHHLANHNQEKLQNAQVGAAIAGILTAAVIGAANQNNPYYGSYQQQRDQRSVEEMAAVGAALGALSYSVEEEREADLLAQYLLVRSGYNLKKAERVLWLLMTINSTGGASSDRAAFGDSHPAGPERIAAWRIVREEIKSNKSRLPAKAQETKKAN